jgi:hypothetical protein
MDKEGDYLVVHGLSLSEIPEASDIKLVFNFNIFVTPTRPENQYLPLF